MPVAQEFLHEYDLASLCLVRPLGQNFSMYVTPRYRYHYEQKPFEAFTAALLSRIIKRARLFLDIGAHYGFFTLLAATNNPDLEVVAAEPIPETFKALKRNIDLLGTSHVTLQQTAISNGLGRAPFIVSMSSDNCGFYQHPNAPPLRTMEVETSSVDALLQHREPCPLVIKIDTEGHEIAILEGMSDTLRRFDDVALIIEFNPEMQRAAGSPPEQLLEELDQLGFETFLLDDVLQRAYRLKPTTNWSALMNPSGYANLYCVRRSRALNLCLFAHSAGLTGAERCLLQLVDELVVDHGVLCTVVLPTHGPLVEALGRVGASCVISEYGWWCDSNDDARTEVERRRAIFLCVDDIIAEVCRTVAQIDPDVIWTQTMVIPWGAVVAWFVGKPHVWSVCEYGERDQDLRFFWPFDRIIADIESSSNLIFTACQDIADEFFPSLSSDRVRTLYRHISIPPSGPDDAKLEFFARANAVKLGIFASIVVKKGQEDIIRATAELAARGQNVELLVAGTGPPAHRRHLNELTKRLEIGDRVQFSGFLADPYPAMRACDIIVICSRCEAFGRVALEGMLLGKPVIYPASGAFTEYMIDGKTGLSYPPGDIGALVDRIEQLIADPDRRVSLGKTAYAYASQRFTRDGYGGAVYRALTDLRSRVVTSPGIPSVIAPTLIKTLAARYQRLNQENASLNLRIDARTQEANQLKRELASVLHKAAVSEAALTVSEAALTVSEAALAGVFSSSSWRLTGPWRAMGTRFPWLKRLVRN